MIPSHSSNFPSRQACRHPFQVRNDSLICILPRISDSHDTCRQCTLPITFSCIPFLLRYLGTERSVRVVPRSAPISFAGPLGGRWWTAVVLAPRTFQQRSRSEPAFPMGNATDRTYRSRRSGEARPSRVLFQPCARIAVFIHMQGRPGRNTGCECWPGFNLYK
jgi:hypothetical protein